MDDLDNLTSEPTETADLQAQIQTLRRVVIFGLMMLFVLSATVNLFLWRLVRINRSELAQEVQVINGYSQYINSPQMQQFFRKLKDYSQTHPDFVPILTKYHFSGPSTPASPPATGTPAAKAPAPAKK